MTSKLGESHVHIISRKKLLESGRRHRDAALPLDAWYRTAKASTWKSLDEVRRTYSHADSISVEGSTYTVFNIGGNKYRLVTKIFYEDQTILVRHVLTHAEYSKEEWKR